jgi:hypothetical protein
MDETEACSVECLAGEMELLEERAQRLGIASIDRISQ